MIEAVYTLDNGFLGMILMLGLIIVSIIGCFRYKLLRPGFVLVGALMMAYNIILLNNVFTGISGDYFMTGYYVFGIITIISVLFIWLGIYSIWKKAT